MIKTEADSELSQNRQIFLNTMEKEPFMESFLRGYCPFLPIGCV